MAARTLIPAYEVWFTFDRSSGPGGQNVNKRSSRVTMWFDVVSSPSLTDRQKSLLQARLRTRINKEGLLRLVASKHRTQAANRRTLEERFVEVIGEALIETPKRKKTRIPKSVKRKRISDKRHRSRTKDARRTPNDDD
ncbi:MAG: aminoacyl-tRNA hydrolase [Phycisphaerae bacterium]|nr:MAG: aminoacyl-tRNA hydrolase [Phycisphaerae bacterium]